MPVNLRARNYAVLMSYADGTGELDVTALVESFTFSNSHLDESGLIKCSGTLVLSAYPNTPFLEDLDPRTNHKRFARGARVGLFVSNSAGNLILHPRSMLRVKRPPAPAHYRNPRIELEVGCLLTFFDWRSAADDVSGVPLTESQYPGTLRDEVINTIAHHLNMDKLTGVPTLTTTILEYPLKHSMPKLSGSWIAQMGQLAFAAGYFLWVYPEILPGGGIYEKIRATRIDDAIAAPVAAEIVIGRDEAVYEPMGSEEAPCKIIRTTATTKIIRKSEDPKPIRTRVKTKDYDPAEITTTSFNGTGSTTPATERVTRQPLGVVIPQKFPRDRRMLTSQVETATQFYADSTKEDLTTKKDGELLELAANDGLLLRSEEKLRQPLGVVLPGSFPGSLAMFTSKRVETVYSYLNNVTTEIATYTYEPVGVVEPFNPEPNKIKTGLTNLITSGYEITRWQRKNKGWLKIVKTADFKTGEFTNTTTYSTSGNNTPPAPERKDQELYADDVAIEGKATVRMHGTIYDQRERTYDVPTATSTEQLNTIAQTLATLLQARRFPCTWAFDLRDAWLEADYHPLQKIRIVENGKAFIYLCDGDTFSLSQRKAAVAGDGLYLGQVKRYNTTGATPTPVTQPHAENEVDFVDPGYIETTLVSGFFELFGSIAHYPYSRDAGSTSVSVTLELFGGSPTEPLRGLFELFGSSFDGSTLDFDWIVTSGGDVVTADGDVVSTQGDFSEIVTAGGDVVTADGDVVAVGTSANWNAIAIDSTGNVIVSNGNVVVEA